MKNTFIVAEISANHLGRIDLAEQIVRAAAKAGADAVKLQTYTPDTLTMRARNPCFHIHGTTWNGRTLYDLYEEAQTPWSWTPRLMRLAHDLGLECFSTPFDGSAVDFLESCGVGRYKVASFELVDTPLLKKIAATGKPVILSTGMATLAEIDEAVRTLREHGSGPITLLKCTSAYPAPPEEANLAVIPHLAQAFACQTGLSDHTPGSAVAVAAVTLGAAVIEKHLTLSRASGGPDSAFSAEPEEFRRLVSDIRIVEKAIGQVAYGPTAHERDHLMFRRSLFVVKDMQAGEPFTPENVRCIRPGHGLPPRLYDLVLGKLATRPLPAGTPLAWDAIGGADAREKRE